MCKCSQKNCDLEVSENKKCVLHCEKDDWYEVDDKGKKNWDKSEEKIQLFWNKFETVVENSENNEFIEINFPPCENLIKKIQNNVEVERFFFRRCKFIGTLSFIEYSIKNLLFFDNCFFYDSLWFIRNIMNTLKFVNCCDFNDNSISSESVVFHNDLTLSSATGINQLNFNGAEFKENADFSSLINLKVVDFSFAIFKKVFDFSQSSCISQINFYATRFEDYLIFSNVKIKCQFDLSNTLIVNKSNFLKIEVSKLNRETARIIKDSFEQQNNIIEANKFYALEMKEMEKELKFFKKPFEWLVFKIHGMASNHSQDFLLVLFWILNITFVTVFLQFELVCENSFVKLFDRFFFFFGGLIFLGYGISKLKENFRNIVIILFSIINYFIYSNTYIDDSSLKLFSNTLNPFSIMTGKEELSFGILLYKITIAYLIYQLIISIRQNTRRK
jgi:hypothetical protein